MHLLSSSLASSVFFKALIISLSEFSGLTCCSFPQIGVSFLFKIIPTDHWYILNTSPSHRNNLRWDEKWGQIMLGNPNTILSEIKKLQDDEQKATLLRKFSKAKRHWICQKCNKSMIGGGSIACDICFRWYHRNCVGFDQNDYTNFICFNCQT